MGCQTEKIIVSYTVSRHNSEQDVSDDQAAENLRMEIEALIAADSDYSRIVNEVTGGY